jgi:hypothetical protein
MKNAVFWDVAPRDSCKNRRFASIIRVTRIGELGTLAVTSNRSTLQEPHGVTSQKTAFFITCILQATSSVEFTSLLLLHA